MTQLRQKVIDPTTLGVNAANITAGSPVTSNAFGIDGMNQLTVYGLVTRVAATAVSMVIEYSLDGTNWIQSRATESILAGVETVNLHSVSFTAVNTDPSIYYQIPINGAAQGGKSMQCRLVFDSTAGGATDYLTVHVVLGAM